MLKLLFPLFSFFLMNSANADDYATGMSEAACRDSVHMVDCFDWTKDKCQAKAKDGVHFCMRHMRMVNGAEDSGRWSIDVGNCAELYLYYTETKRIKDTPECQKYFAERKTEFGVSPYRFAIDARIERTQRASSLLLTQMFVTLLFSLGLPFLFSWLKMRREIPKRFPILYLFVSEILGLGGAIVASTILVFSGNFAQSIAANGDNPTAIGGTSVGWFLAIFLIPIGNYIIYRIHRAR